jgi:hypothetical protein
VEFEDYVRLEQLIWRQWPARTSRPTLARRADGSWEPRTLAYFTSRYSVLHDLDAQAATQAVNSLAASTKWEPTLAEIRAAAEGRAEDTGWSDAWRRLAAAVEAHHNAEPSKLEWVELEDGTVRREFPEGHHPDRWREVAGEDVAAVIDQLGGIVRAALSMHEMAYQAHFRDLYVGAKPTGDPDAGRRATNAMAQLVAANPEIAKMLPRVSSDHARGRELPSG